MTDPIPGDEQEGCGASPDCADENPCAIHGSRRPNQLTRVEEDGLLVSLEHGEGLRAVMAALPQYHPAVRDYIALTKSVIGREDRLSEHEAMVQSLFNCIDAGAVRFDQIRLGDCDPRDLGFSIQMRVKRRSDGQEFASQEPFYNGENDKRHWGRQLLEMVQKAAVRVALVEPSDGMPRVAAFKHDEDCPTRHGGHCYCAGRSHRSIADPEDSPQ